MKAKLYSFYLLAIYFSVLLTGCKKEKEEEIIIPEKKYPQFFGEWEWRITNTRRLKIETPASTGYNEVLFLGDDNNYSRTRNNEIREQSKYYIQKQKARDLPDSVFVFYYARPGAQIGPVFSKIGKDTLVIDHQNCSHCPIELFVRKK